MAGNRSALLTYGGVAMADPALAGRLPSITAPTLIVWGAADRIVAPSHGRAYAEAIHGATLRVIDEAGHLPQIETPDVLADVIWDFADRHAVARPPEGSRPTHVHVCGHSPTSVCGCSSLKLTTVRSPTSGIIG